MRPTSGNEIVGWREGGCLHVRGRATRTKGMPSLTFLPLLLFMTAMPWSSACSGGFKGSAGRNLCWSRAVLANGGGPGGGPQGDVKGTARWLWCMVIRDNNLRILRRFHVIPRNRRDLPDPREGPNFVPRMSLVLTADMSPDIRHTILLTQYSHLVSCFKET